MKPKKQKYPSLSKRKQDEILAPILGEKPSLPRKLAKRIKQGVTTLIPALKPPPTLDEYIGREIRVNVFDESTSEYLHKEGESVVIESIKGSGMYPSRFEINDKHWVVILDFYGQINGEEMDEESLKAFDGMTYEVKPAVTAPIVKEDKNEIH